MREVGTEIPVHLQSVYCDEEDGLGCILEDVDGDENYGAPSMTYWCCQFAGGMLKDTECQI